MKIDKSRKAIRKVLFAVRAFLLVAIVSKKRRVLVIGDSHARVFSGPGFLVRHLGPITLNRACREGEAERIVSSSFRSPRIATWLVRLLFRDPQSIVVLSFGEIDIRAHVYLQSLSQGRSGDEVVISLAKSTLEFVDRVSKLARRNVIFLSIPPPTSIHLNEKFPTRGDFSDRVSWTRLLNQQIRVGLNSMSTGRVAFLERSSIFEDPSGAMIPELSDGGIHFSKVCSRFMRDAIVLSAISRKWW